MDITADPAAESTADTNNGVKPETGANAKTHKASNTIYSRLVTLASMQPESVAMRYKDKGDLSYAGLLTSVQYIQKQLHSYDIGSADRVAIVCPSGPEMALTILGVMSTAACAPLNSKYTAAEFEFYLTDLNIKAVVVPRGSKSSVLDVAQQLNIKTIEIIADKAAPLGQLELSCNLENFDKKKDARAGNQNAPSVDHIALILHTSGTTSRPKIVPLSQNNVCTSADNIAKTLLLQNNDCCLNIMPLFHIHGIMAGLLAPVVSGGSVICSPGFSENPLFIAQFYPWLIEMQPTWYTAVPTMHQAILGQADKYPDIAKQCQLRFIRSSSASLAPQIMSALEDLFNAPVIEAYGMTEASHQMASNPLPPAVRKPKSVGIAAGPEVSIMDDQGNILKAGETGEIVIRGANVMSAYENNDNANGQSFHGDWFRTGDEGVMDEGNYLFITGRLKEMINRGGEKISPREIDEVLLDHPAVGQAVAFAVPHPTLGEVAAAAIVLREGEALDAQSLKAFAAQKLASFKIPNPILFVDEIPKGPTGKLQRIGLAEKLL